MKILMMWIAALALASCSGTPDSDASKQDSAYNLQESGILSNGWRYSLFKHEQSAEDRYFLHVVESDGKIRDLYAHRVQVSPQTNGTTAIHFGVKDYPWESPIAEWWDLLNSPGLYLDSQRKNNGADHPTK